MKQKVFIIILNWNRKDLTVECIQSLKKVKAHGLDIHTVIVDNHSSDDSISTFKQFPHITTLVNKSNLGYAEGNNVGIKFAMRHNADIILLLNNDVLVTPNILIRLLSVINSDEKIGIVGPMTYYTDKKKIIADAGGIIMKHRYFGVNRGQKEKDKGQFDKISEVDFISGSAMLIKSSVFKKIGLLDGRFFLYYEDADLCFRAKKAGFKSVFVPETVIYHTFGATSGIGSAIHHYYTTRNHYLFVEKHAPITVKVKEFLRMPKTIWEFMKSTDKAKKKYSLLGIRDYYLRHFEKGNFH